MHKSGIRRLAAGSLPLLSGAAAILLAVAIVLSPEASFEASLKGLKLWWTLVFPALLPFLILSEMLTASGFVHGFGVLLEPLMTRVFRLPGAASWTLALGMTAGFPAGAGGTGQLHQQGSLTSKEAGRLAALAHFASPVTVLIVIGVAFLHSPTSGYILLLIHWSSGLLAGFTASLFQRREASTPPPSRKPLYRRMALAAEEAHRRDGRSFGKLLGESVAAAVQQLMIAGGYIIMFAVVISLLTKALPLLSPAFPAALLELHLGAAAITAEAGYSGSLNGSLPAMVLLSAALGWSGICAQLQALTLLKPAGVRFLPMAAVRLLHSLYAAVLTLLVWKPLQALRANELPVLAEPDGAQTAAQQTTFTWSRLPELLSLQGALLLALLALSAAVYLFSRKRHPAG
ncbi:nucleoside recognition domain-containing protein [Paenibacillus donghaensis]|uniref:Nucleoside transporter/FeoB GTPase Gate domain-containing protein n=1 Tax=Paenibacillus donghaensis TaxID=414771 RepID=A0A2Z2K806_9BACL|nr:nucleoside recognition domain-containing protein [Paenibacillus donghaensis]ASA21297.1 hypothetical protein B9T62_11170 [Paenibacillus donghaensis]